MDADVRESVDSEFQRIWDSLTADIPNPLKRLKFYTVNSPFCVVLSQMDFTQDKSLHNSSISNTFPPPLNLSSSALQTTVVNRLSAPDKNSSGKNDHEDENGDIGNETITIYANTSSSFDGPKSSDSANNVVSPGPLQNNVVSPSPSNYLSNTSSNSSSPLNRSPKNNSLPPPPPAFSGSPSATTPKTLSPLGTSVAGK